MAEIEAKKEETGKRKDDRRGRSPRDNAREKPQFDKEAWTPKTDVGKKVKSGEIKDVAEILDSGMSILEPEIVEVLLPNIETDLLLIGQSKGKFGGGQRRVFKQTQKKTREGNKPKFATYAVAGNSDGYVGVGYGKSKETVPAREKAIRRSKLNIFKVRRGCGSWQCNCDEPHSIPFKVEGKCGSVVATLLPAPKGKGRVAQPEYQKIMKLAGIKDVWVNLKGQTGVRDNAIIATIAALKQLMKTKIRSDHPNLAEGAVLKEEKETEEGAKDDSPIKTEAEVAGKESPEDTKIDSEEKKNE